MLLLHRKARKGVHFNGYSDDGIFSGGHTGGNISAAAQSLSFHHLSKIAGEIHASYPDIRFYITSGDTADLIDQLDNGLIDIALIFTEYDHTLYQGIRLPNVDTLGLLMRRDDPLASQDVVTIADLQKLPLIIPRASLDLLLSDPDMANLHIVTVYNLIYNASLLVEDGVGYAVGFEGLINTSGDSPLVFRPLEVRIPHAGTVIWKKYTMFSPAVNLFLDRLKRNG